MNHKALAEALCGRYVKLEERAGYLESVLSFPCDGALIGAYVVDAGDGRVRVTDDGDTLFNVARFGVKISNSKRNGYRTIATSLGFSLGNDGVITATCASEVLPQVMGRYVQAVSSIAQKALRQRPRESDRFERLIGALLEESYGGRLQKRITITGLSGHQLQFPFGLDMQSTLPVIVQPIAARPDKTINWPSVYEAGGKFQDVRAATSSVRLIAVLESAADADKASRFFSEDADVRIYDGGPLLLAA